MTSSLYLLYPLLPQECLSYLLGYREICLPCPSYITDRIGVNKYYDLLLEIWREACRHIELEESLTRIGALLADVLPIRELALYHVDKPANRVQLLSFLSVPAGRSRPSGAVLEERQVARIAAWCKTGVHLRFTISKPPAQIPHPLLSGLSEHVMAIALASEHGTLGVLFMGSGGSHFGENEEQLAALMREPLTVALENDRRLHELMALREAAEADKRKLLTRLGREGLAVEIVGASGGLRMVMERAALVAGSDAPVLILGETGSGKEVIAQAIHNSSLRASGPFIRVNCGAISPELIDSELFGHERGSFTGAVSVRKGWFERAHGGTLFLDEIGELSLAAQVRLLRVLQDSTFERVGGERALHADVRLIAATHRDLAALVQQHTFREDLWYRIAVFPIVLPPLRERKDDIPELATHFARRAARRFGLRLQLPSAEDNALLAAYEWPGNVRELASVLDRAAILGGGERLEIAKSLGISPATPTIVVGMRATTDITTPKVIVTLDEALRLHIEYALKSCQGRIEGPHGAARVLKINPHTLRARMRKLGVDWGKFRNQSRLADN